MKIILEDVDTAVTEVTIRGNIADPKVQHILSLLKDSQVSSKIFLFQENTEILVDIADIYYFEVLDRKTFATTQQGKFLCKHTLSELLTLFKRHGITQIAKSVLVNVRHVTSLEAEFSGNYTANLKNDDTLVASRFYMKTFREAIMEG